MAFSIDDIRAAQQRISSHIVRTPLLRLKNLDEALGCQVYIKAENMQTAGSFKLRGALNRSLSLAPDELARGLVCASSGNHGRGIAYAAKLLGTHATVVMPRSSPRIKADAIKALGAEVVLCEVDERFQIAEKLCAEKNATLIPPYDDEYVMAGQGTAGLEIVEQCPDLDTVIVPVSGGGLIGGISTAVKTLAPQMKIFGAEPAAQPRYGKSLAAGKIVTVPKQATLADALVTLSPGVNCFPVVQRNVDEMFAVDDSFMLKAMKILLTEGK